MQDSQIVRLYLQRKEDAIRETEQKYAAYLSEISGRILEDWEDRQECVNETYFRAWNSIPPHHPQNLKTYLGKMVRQLSIDVYRTKTREKRKATEYAVCLDELSECIPDSISTEQILEAKELEQAVASYLKTLEKEKRVLFICRYYYMDSIAALVARFSMSESKVKSMLHRTRKGLERYLQKEGYLI